MWQKFQLSGASGEMGEACGWAQGGWQLWRLPHPPGALGLEVGWRSPQVGGLWISLPLQPRMGAPGWAGCSLNSRGGGSGLAQGVGGCYVDGPPPKRLPQGLTRM